MAVQNEFIQVANGSTESASSWIYLVNWILILILGIAFVFFFGRLAGYVLSMVLRVVLWHRLHIMVSVESIRLSLLGGRLMIKNLVITTENQTVSILRVNLTWRYWLWGATRLSEYNVERDVVSADENARTSNKDAVTKAISENEKLPSRFLLSMEGLEIFMYNRVFAYENIEELLSKNNGPSGEKPGTADALNRTFSTTESTTDSKSDDSSMENADYDPEKPYKTLRVLLRVLPISLLIKKAVVIAGNRTTPSLVVLSCKTATGIFDAKGPCSSLDVYKQLLFFELENFQVSMKPNIAYEGLKQDDSSKSNNAESISKFKRLQKTLNIIPSIFTKITQRKPTIQVSYSNWVGLRRYLGDSLDDLHHLFVNLPNYEDEYAKYSLLLDSKLTKVSYYYDIPGLVRELGEESSPDFGIDVDLSMATIHYGPWADKQRVPIQTAFFPTIARDAEPTVCPRPGQPRQYRGFKMNVVTGDEIIFRVPTREVSKDKEVLKSNQVFNSTTNQQNPQQKQVRPFGWIELKVGGNSSVSMFSSFACSEEEGYPNTLSAVFVKPELSSSVNHDILYMADLHTMDAKIGFPLKWNGHCEWSFDNFSSNSQIFFLREHTLLISDIFEDFGSGPPVPYENFRPFTYIFNWTMNDYKIYLNVNESNIIDNPLDFSRNKYISVQGEELKINSSVPLLGQFTRLTTVDYHAYAPYFNVMLDVPPWHTAHAFMRPSTLLGRAECFTIDGSYTYFSSIEVQTCNNIVIRANADNVMLKLYGAWVKYVFIIRENYMGNNFHFKTFEEHNEALAPSDSESVLSAHETLPGDFDYWKMVKTENNVDVLFSFQVKGGLIVLPHDIYDCKKHIALSLDSFDADIRFTNFYMDMQTDLSPVYGKMVVLPADSEEDEILIDIDNYVKNYNVRQKPDLYLDDLTIHGHRMFGIPPEEITYYCNWRVATEQISIDSEPEFLEFFGDTASSLGFNFVDLQNTLHHVVPTVYDALFFTFQCPSVNIRTNMGDRAMILALNSFTMTFNDLANPRYTSRLSLHIPEISVKVVSCDGSGQIHAFFRTSLTMANITRKPKYNDHRRLQQGHIRFNDAPFHRTPFLLFDETKDSNYNDAYSSMIVPMSLPNAPHPLNKHTKRIYDMKNSSSLSLSSFSSSESSFDQSSAETENEGLKNLFMKPTLHYHDDDFAPESQKDPKYKYDSFIVTFGDVVGYASPLAVDFLAGFSRARVATDIYDIMDTFEKDMVSSLKALMQQVCMDDTFRIVAPMADITFGKLKGTTEEEITRDMKSQPSINVLISEPSIAMSSKVTREKKDDSYVVEKDSTVAVSLKSIGVNVSNPGQFALPISLSVKDVEVWMTDSDSSSVISVTNDEIRVSLDESQAVWFISYVHELLEDLQPSFKVFEQISKIKKNSNAALVYVLSTGSKEFKIDHDPDVLTRPAYLLRSLKEHIRFMDTWVVLIRLRYILNNMDQEWIKQQQDSLAASDWEIPDTAYDEAWAIFSDWRSWEANFVEREAFFQKLFDVHPLVEKKTIARTLLNKVIVSLSNENSMANDFLSFQDIHISVFNKQKEIMFSKIDELAEDDFDASVSAFELLVNLGSYKGVISSITLEILPSIMDELGKIIPKSDSSSEPDEPLESTKGQISRNSGVFITSNVNNFEQKLLLDCLSFDFAAKDFNLNGIYQVIESEKYLSLTNKSSSLAIDAHANGEHIFHQGFEELAVLFGNGMQERNMIFTDFFIEHAVTEIKSKKLSKVIASAIEQDMKYLDCILNKKENPVKESEATNSTLLDLFSTFDLTMSFQMNHYTCLIDVLDPIVFEGAVYDNNLSLLLCEGVLDVSSLLQKVDLSAKFKNDSTVVKIEHSQVFNNIKMATYHETPIIYIDSQFGFSKVLAPRLVTSLNELLNAYQPLKAEIDDIIKAVESLPQKKENDAAQQREASTASSFDVTKVPIDLKISNDYMSVTFVADRSRYAIEVEDFDLKVSNIMVGDKLVVVPFFGSLMIPSTRVSVVDRIIPVGLSNVVDFSVSVKILSEQENTKGQILEVSSQYCRVCLSASVIQRVVVLVDELTIVGKRVEKELNLASREDNIANKEGLEKGKPAPKDTNRAKMDGLDVFSNITGVHFLSHRFCFGWIFENDSKSYPGLMVGAERFYAVTDEKMGKLSLLEAYLAVAHGNTSSSFYGAHSERNNINRAFLPFMQFTYIISDSKGMKDMKVAITGDQLDVDYLSSAIHILEYSVQSASRLQEFFDSRVRPMDKWKDDSKTSEEQHIDYLNSLRSTFTSIEFTTMFAGSNVLIHKLGASDTADDEGSLFLQFPAVKSVTTYSHDKVGAKKHSIRSEILTSSSDNKLHASCVPVLVDLVEGAKQMMKKQALQPNNQSSAPRATAASDKSSKPTDSKHFASSFLAENDFYLGIKVDGQKLSFSCEPTAKVEAVVGMGGICFVLNSGADSSIDLMGTLSTVTASLQHVYSREVAGSIRIDRMVLSTNVDFTNQADIKSAVSLSDMEGYINLKQYQDVALFSDIWFPESTHPDHGPEPAPLGTTDPEKLSANKNITQRFREVSTTNAIPWLATLILSNLKLKVNCGPSLGEMMFTLGQFWLVSKKTPDWTQILKSGINSFEIVSQGRLGGRFFGQDIYLHSEIDWKTQDGQVLDVPLILMSFGIDKLCLKSTFDYHVFAVVNAHDLSIDIFNQKNELSISKDHLFVNAQFKNVEIFMSSFTASNVLDIYNTILRMTQENRISYKETLRDSSKDNKTDSLTDKLFDNAILNSVKRLETEFKVVPGRFMVQVYPSSFEDSKVLVVRLDKSMANFSQNEYNRGISNQLEILFNHLTVSLSVNDPVPENFVQETTVENFSKHANKARGGNLFVFPSFRISMKTFQKYHSNLVEYVYESTFGGTVDIRWNLGSVNFIREMYTIHSKSLESRTEFKRSLKQSKPSQPSVVFNEEIFEYKSDKTVFDNSLMDPKANQNEKIDEAISEKIDKVSSESKYVYLPLAPPIIQAPQLKELGNATPPLEWFGLHRNKFPNVTHELGIVNLQKIIHHIENEYSRLLGKA